jgi:hypothetical protein
LRCRRIVKREWSQRQTIGFKNGNHGTRNKVESIGAPVAWVLA